MMKMITKAVLTAVSMAAVGLFANTSFASSSPFEFLGLQTQHMVMDQAHTAGLNWKVGERNEYEVDLTIAKGTLSTEVTEISAEGLWIDQNMDLGFLGKQTSRTLFDKDTGAIKKILIDGKEQEIPKNDSEVVETKEDNVTVPAGTFRCIYAKLKDTKTEKITEAWINPQEVPINGMLKMVAAADFGTVTMSLTKFVKK